MTDPDPKPMANANCCHLLKRAIRDDRFPIFYDDLVEEVELQTTDGSAVVRYCPFCGQKLESGRSALFTEMTEDDRDDVRSKLHGLNSLDEVITKLGKPDETGTGGGPSWQPWEKWIRYQGIWNSLVLTVGESQDGKLSWSLSGQRIQKSLSQETTDN